MTTARKRGPRNDVDVPSRLLDIAERLFGTSSFHEVSLRAVAREAGVSPAAVPHHFATKRDLATAVIKRRSRSVGVSLHHDLTLLRDRRRRPTPYELIEAVVRPFVAVLDEDPVAGNHWMKLFAELALAGDVIWTEELGAFGKTSELFDAVAMRALPRLRGEAFAQRLAISMYGILVTLSRVDSLAYGQPLTEQGLDPAFVEQLIVFTSAGLAGPV